MEVNGAKQLFGSNHSIDYRLLCSLWLCFIIYK